MAGEEVCGGRGARPIDAEDRGACISEEEAGKRTCVVVLVGAWVGFEPSRKVVYLVLSRRIREP